MADSDTDWNAALRHAGGDRELLTELAVMFADDCPRLLGAARAAIDRQDCVTLEREAHTLKGRLAFFALERLCADAAHIEELGRRADLSAARRCLGALERELTPLLPEFRALPEIS